MIEENYLRQTNFENGLLKDCASKNVVPALTQFLENYKDEEDIVANATELLLALSNRYPELFTSGAGKRPFVRAIIKETRNELRTANRDPKSLAKVSQNLTLLSKIAENSDTLSLIIAEGGQDLALNVASGATGLSGNMKILFSQGSMSSRGPLAGSLGANPVENVISSSLDLLEKMLNLPVEQRQAVPDLPQQLINALESASNSVNALRVLGMLEKASRMDDLAGPLAENELLERIMNTCTSYPNNKAIESKVGDIVANLGANTWIPQMAEQVAEISQGFDIKDLEVIESYKGALDYYGNLLTAGKDTQVEENSSLGGAKAVGATIASATEHGDLLNSHIRVVRKLAERDPEAKAHLRESDAAPTLAALLAEDFSATGQQDPTEQVIRALKSLADEKASGPKLLIDGMSGEERKLESASNEYANNFLIYSKLSSCIYTFEF